MQNDQDRRKALVQRLFQQYTSGRQQPGKASPGLGTPFHANTFAPPLRKTNVTQSGNVRTGLLAALGNTALPLAGDASSFRGGEVSQAPDIQLPLPSPVALPLPAMSQGGSTPPPDIPGQAGAGQPPVGTSTGNTTSQGYPLYTGINGPTVDPGFDSMPSDAVSLGGGIYFSPTVGYINLSNQNFDVNSLGSAAAKIGTNLPV